MSTAPEPASPAENLSGRVWVRPNRNTVGLGAVLLAMWYAGASQNNGAAYLLCFTLTGLTMVSALHAWANLRGIVLIADPIRPVCVGERRLVPLRAQSRRHRAHFGLKLKTPDTERAVELETIPVDETVSTELPLKSPQRGLFPAVRVRLISRYPLGFFTSSRSFVLTQPHYVYPEPGGTRPLPVSVGSARHARDGHRVEGDDFGGVRTWRTGESQRHIDWKAAARGQPLLVKQWFGDTDETLHFEWESLAGLDVEARLSQLTRWVILAERDSASYGLRLPGVTVPAARGEGHYHACLRALAQFQSPEPTA